VGDHVSVLRLSSGLGPSGLTWRPVTASMKKEARFCCCLVAAVVAVLVDGAAVGSARL